MRSLRARLILGVSLITVLPLAAAIFILTERIEAMVRGQAEERLGSALGAIRAGIASDAERVSEKLEILARDPQLKRLYLVRAGGRTRELSDYLAERRFLLDLDFLQVADPGGAVVAETPAEFPSVARADSERRLGPAVDRIDRGAAIEPVEGMPALAMAASVPIRYQNEPAGTVRGGLIFGSGFLARLGRAGGVELTLSDAGGRTVASTLPVAVGASVPALPGVERLSIARTSYLSRSAALEVGEPPHARIAVLASTTPADRTIGALKLASALIGLLALGIAVLLGALWSAQISRPVERLAAFSDRLARGEWDEPLTLRSVRELETLVAALDRMRRDLLTYRTRLVTSERHAAWSQMARKVAHEVKNPLTPIAISIADLRRSYEIGRADFPQVLDQAVRTIGEEVETLKRLLTEFADFARFPEPTIAPCDWSSLVDDLGALYGQEVAAGRLVLSRAEPEILFPADRGQMRQALINLIKNGLESLRDGDRVIVSARADDQDLELQVSDTGPGLTEEQEKSLFVPGFTTKAHGSGLGLTIVERIVSEHQGTIAVESAPGRGTTFRIRLPLFRRT